MDSIAVIDTVKYCFIQGSIPYNIVVAVNLQTINYALSVNSCNYSRAYTYFKRIPTMAKCQCRIFTAFASSSNNTYTTCFFTIGKQRNLARTTINTNLNLTTTQNVGDISIVLGYGFSKVANIGFVSIHIANNTLQFLSTCYVFQSCIFTSTICDYIGICHTIGTCYLVCRLIGQRSIGIGIYNCHTGIITTVNGIFLHLSRNKSISTFTNSISCIGIGIYNCRTSTVTTLNGIFLHLSSNKSISTSTNSISCIGICCTYRISSFTICISNGVNLNIASFNNFSFRVFQFSNLLINTSYLIIYIRSTCNSTKYYCFTGSIINGIAVIATIQHSPI